MALPKGFRNNIRLTSPNVGVQRRQDLLDNIADDGTFLPRGVHYQDMDETFINFVNKELRIEIDGEEVPVLFLTLQRYSEFTKTWKFTDEYKNIKIPFVTIVRKPDPQVGTNQAGLYNVPGRPTFTYYKVPTNDGARVGVDLYKIPQPTSVDITYEVRMFTNKMSDLNLLNEKVQKKFQSRQAYIWPKGHPMPVTLESIGDESNIDDFENRRFYVQPFEMLLAGYILDEEDFEIMPTINRAMVMSELIVGDGVTTPVTDGTNSPGCIVAAQGSSSIKNTAGTLLSVVECGSNYVVGNSLVFNSGSTYSQIIPATTNLELPNVVNIDSDGSSVLTPAQVGFTATTCDPVTIINSGATYTASTAAGTTFELPNQVIDIENETGGTINTITFPVYSDPTIDLTAYCQSVIVNNSGGTFNQTIEPGSAYTLPNVVNIDSDGSSVLTPAQVGFTATTSNLVDPPSFSNALALFRSDAGYTLVDNLLDVWADQSGNGYDASASSSSKRLRLYPNKGKYDFKDIVLTGADHFRSTALPSTAMQQYSYDICITTFSLHNPPLYAPMWGNVNSSQYPLFVGIGNKLQFTVKPNTGNLWTIDYDVAQTGDYYSIPLKLTVLVDLTQSAAADKFKLYRDGSLITQSSTSGTLPGTSDTVGNGIFSVISTSTARQSSFSLGYVAVWNRLLTADEIAANNDWKDEIWG